MLVAFILIFLAIAAGGLFLNRKLSEDNLSVAPDINNVEIKNKLVGDSSASFMNMKENFNGDNINKINMKLTSPTFGNNQYIPSKYTCDGVNINPPLSISGAPNGTESLVLIVDDPDAPAGTWDHWIVWNINPIAVGITENSSPAARVIKKGSVPAPTILNSAVEGITSFGKPGYGGPCPSSGIHHYQFKLYALDIVLNLDASSGKKEIEKAMEGHILAEDLLIGLYKRK